MVQTASRAFRLWPWPTQQQLPSLEPPYSSMHRPVMASRYWFPVTRWWSKVRHIDYQSHTDFIRFNTHFMLPQLPPVTSRLIRSEQPLRAPSPQELSWPHPQPSLPRVLPRKLRANGKFASWRTGMGGVCCCQCRFLLMHEKFPSIPPGVFGMIQKQETSLQARLHLPQVPDALRINLKDKLCLIPSAERQPANVAGRRRSMLSVWRTELLSWRTKTRH